MAKMAKYNYIYKIKKNIIKIFKKTFFFSPLSNVKFSHLSHLVIYNIFINKHL